MLPSVSELFILDSPMPLRVSLTFIFDIISSHRGRQLVGRGNRSIRYVSTSQGKASELATRVVVAILKCRKQRPNIYTLTNLVSLCSLLPHFSFRFSKTVKTIYMITTSQVVIKLNQYVLGLN